MAVSIQLIAILAIVMFLMILLPQQYLWEIVLAFLLFVPSSAQGLISGTSYSTSGIINISMVGYVTILATLCLLIKHKGLRRKESTHVFLCFIIILSIRIVVDGFGFISNKILDNYFLPMLLAILILSCLKTEYIPRLFKFMYICILFGAVIACIEYFYGKSLFFHDYYMSTCPWYVNIYNSSQWVSFRSVSFFGHPLIGAIYYLLAVVYFFNSKNANKYKIFTVLQFILLVSAILTTNSRSALLGLAVYIIFYLLEHHRMGKLTALIIAAAVFAIFVDWKEVYNSLFARDNSGSSLMVRVRALLTIVDIPLESFLFGEGYNSTSSLLKYLGFGGNVEISYLIILMENGIIGFVAWLISVLLLYKKNMVKSIGELQTASIVKGMLLCIIIVGAMSNSFGDPGTLNYTIYMLLGLSSFLANVSQEEVDWIKENTPPKTKVRFVLRGR